MNRHEMIGWLLFTASACCFVIASVRSGDVTTLLGSVLFLIACFFFMAPLAGRRKLQASTETQGNP